MIGVILLALFLGSLLVFFLLTSGAHHSWPKDAQRNTRWLQFAFVLLAIATGAIFVLALLSTSKW